MMESVRVDVAMLDALAPLAALFRVALLGFKGVESTPDVAAGRAEIAEYLEAGYPVYCAMEGGEALGYAVCRVEEPVVWLESLFVREEARRRGAATALLREAEALAASYGESTLYFNVHPNNAPMIAFLRRHGYTVLNLIEIRRPYVGERPRTRLRVGENEFDY